MRMANGFGLGLKATATISQLAVGGSSGMERVHSLYIPPITARAMPSAGLRVLASIRLLVEVQLVREVLEGRWGRAKISCTLDLLSG